MSSNPPSFTPELRAEVDRLQFALQAAGLGTWDYDLITNQAQWSGICKELFGLPAHTEVTAAELLAQVHPDDRPRVDQANRQVLSPASDGVHDITFRTLSLQGTLQWVQAKGRVLRNEQGQPVRFSGVVVDVTGSVVAHQQLEASEQLFRSLIEQAPMAIGLFKGREMIIEVGNDRIFEVWGKDASVIGLPVIEALPEIKGQGYIELLEGVYDSGRPYVGTNLLVQLNRRGKLEDVYFDLLYTPLRGATGAISGVMVLANEVTQIVTSRRQIEASEARYRHLSEDLDEQVRQRVAELATTNDELTASTHELLVSSQELTEANKRLVRSNDNLRQFAYVASHDLQEPLRKIQQFGDILKTGYATQLGEGIDYLNRMQTAASRMSTLIRDLLAFSRITTQPDTTKEVSLTELFGLVVSNLDLVIQETGAVVTVGPMPQVLGDPLQLGQLFQNLLTNALKFHRPGTAPRIQISAHLVAQGNLPDGVKPSRSALIYHRIAVSDNGIGFDEKYLDRIFAVFQRLHGTSAFAGTGIGLAICEKVATNHGGAITATSTPGQGATFSVYLPV